MAFRRNRSETMEWDAFLRDYNDHLTAIGIPEVTLRSQKDWYYFVEHGYDFYHPELLNIDDVAPERLASWLPIFEEMDSAGHYVGDTGGILSWLRARNQPKAQQGADDQLPARAESKAK